MQTFTTNWRWLGIMVLMACFAGSAQAQRTVTLTLNAATIPDTTSTMSFMEVRGAADTDGDGAFEAPVAINAAGDMIDWGTTSTIEPVNIGGDYWQITFELDNATDLQFKYFSQQAEDIGLNGWEADPNPILPAGDNDTTLAVHFFESQAEYRGVNGDRGEYDWRPWESKEDTVAVWFRVAMYGPSAETSGYDAAAEAPAQQMGIRGDDFGQTGPLDWGNTKVVLQRESSISSTAGYNIYSGVAYYPTALVGSTQAYKFVRDNDVLNDGDLGWESDVATGNRLFTVPANDTTLQWVYFSDTKPTAAQRVSGTVVYTVNMDPLESLGLFDASRGDTLLALGGWNGWGGCRDNPTQESCLLTRFGSTNDYEGAFLFNEFPGTSLSYKFFLEFNDEAFETAFGRMPPPAWEEPPQNGGGDRNVTFDGDASGFQVIPPTSFNSLLPDNIIADGESVDVMFTVDMSPAADPNENSGELFDPAVHSVHIKIQDALKGFLMGYDTGNPDNTDKPVIWEYELTDDDGDMVYTGTVTFTGPDYALTSYLYAFGDATTETSVGNEAGNGLSAFGRHRTRWVPRNSDGTWPAVHSFPAETYAPNEQEMPVDPNPAEATSVEPVGGELPTAVTLSPNYPNPFNPSTTFAYTLDRTSEVTIRVYDLLGRVVQTLVEGVQTANTYQVTFDASNLASGTYLYRLETANQVITRQMVLLK